MLVSNTRLWILAGKKHAKNVFFTPWLRLEFWGVDSAQDFARIGCAFFLEWFGKVPKIGLWGDFGKVFLFSKMFPFFSNVIIFLQKCSPFSKMFPFSKKCTFFKKSPKNKTFQKLAKKLSSCKYLLYFHDKRRSLKKHKILNLKLVTNLV